MWTTEQIEATQEHMANLLDNLDRYKEVAAELVESLEEYKHAEGEHARAEKMGRVLKVFGSLDYLNYCQGLIFKDLYLF